MNKFVAAAAIGLVALAVPCPPAPAAQSTSQVVPPVGEGAGPNAGEVRAATETSLAPPPSCDGAGGGAETPGVRLASSVTLGPVTAAGRVAASGLAVVMWLAVTAGLVTRRSGWPRRRRATGRAMSDEELRDLLGLRPRARPAT